MSAAGMSRSSRRSQAFPRRGVATVELAVLLPPLVLLLFGSLEIGLMAKHSQALNHAAREGARVAATGASTTRIHAYTADAAAGIDADRVAMTIQYRQRDTDAGSWGSWITLTDVGSENCAQVGDQIRVQMRYSYTLATGAMFATLFGASPDNVVTIDATMVSMRE